MRSSDCDGPRAARHRRRIRMTARRSTVEQFWMWLATGLLVYASLRQLDKFLDGDGYAWTRLVDIPRQVRIAEIAIIAVVAWRALSCTACPG